MRIFNLSFGGFKKDFVYVALELGSKDILSGFTAEGLVEELKNNNYELVNNSSRPHVNKKKLFRPDLFTIDVNELDIRLNSLVGNYFSLENGVYKINTEGYFRSIQYKEFKRSSISSKIALAVAAITLVISLSAVFVTLFNPTTSIIEKNQFELFQKGIDNAIKHNSTILILLENVMKNSNTTNESIGSKFDTINKELEFINKELSKIKSLSTTNN